jgi:hypothetical protein
MSDTRWVKVQDGQIVAGPDSFKPDDTYVEYVEVLNLTPPYTRVTVDIAMVNGKCVKTVTSVPDYSIQRATAYPPIGDQLDDFWHAMDNNLIPRIEPFYSQVKVVKDKYPKPPQ